MTATQAPAAQYAPASPAAEFVPDPELVAAVRDRVARKLASHIEYDKDRRAELAALPARILAAHALVARLHAAGFHQAHVYYDEEVRVDVTQKDLTKLYHVVGRLKAAGTDLVDARKRLMRVSLACVAHPTLAVSYERKLPKTGAKCKIVREKTTRVYLSCEV
jgi:hypothetical protein